MQNLTVIILTKNEEKNIKAVIENAKKLSDNVLVVDSGSTDNTVSLAQASGAKVVFRVWNNDFAAQRNFALECADTKWVLYLDADECMNDELIADIRKAVAADNPAVYRFIRRTSAFGRDFKYGVLGPDSVLRLLPRDSAKWDGKVHEAVKNDLPVITLKGYLKHNTYTDFKQYLEKMNLYSSIGAENNYRKGKRASVISDMLLRPIFAFFKMYVLELGFLEGWLGFVLCLNYANYTLNKYVKLKLLEKGRK